MEAEAVWSPDGKKWGNGGRSGTSSSTFNPAVGPSSESVGQDFKAYLTKVIDIMSNKHSGTYWIVNIISTQHSGTYWIVNIISNQHSGTYWIVNIISNQHSGTYWIVIVASHQHSATYWIVNVVLCYSII